MPEARSASTSRLAASSCSFATGMAISRRTQAATDTSEMIPRHVASNAKSAGE